MSAKQKPITSIIPNDPLSGYQEGEIIPTAQLAKQSLEERLNYAYFQIVLGNRDKAIKILQPLADDPPEDKDYAFVVYHYMGLAYQRQGEINNCNKHHSNEACILPIRGKGVHMEPEGSEKAIEYYLKCLKLIPDESVTRWLITICNETLGGKYTDELKDILVPLTTFDRSYEPGPFTEVAGKLGLDDFNLLGGVVIEDMDNDGLLDVFTTSYLLGDNVKLYKNTGTGFKNVTEQANLTGITGGTNTIQADYNNDGFTDIFITRGGWLEERGFHPQSLLRNNGDGTFTDVTAIAGLLTYQPSQSASWADIDNDGDLDLFLANENFMPENKQNKLFSQLYLNNGDETFTDVAKNAGLTVNHYVKAAVFGDINNDNYPDLFLSLYKGGNQLYVNTFGETGTIGFKEIGAIAGIVQPYFSFTSAIFDFNNDGLEDILVFGYQLDNLADLTSEYDPAQQVDLQLTPKLYINNGNETFTDISHKAGLDRSIYAMGGNIGDIDNDGWMDVYAATGQSDYRALYPNLMLRNVNGNRFEDVTNATRTGHLQKGHAVAFGDIDNDGDGDLFAQMGGFLVDDSYFNCVFENPGSTNNWIRLKLTGNSTNRSAIGARIKLTIWIPDKGFQNLYRTVNSGASYGANPLEQLIGIGVSKRITSIEIQWPGSGITQQFVNIPINRRYGIEEQVDTLNHLDMNPLQLKQEPTQHMHNGHHHH